jgi:membrane peptidoglycan carboxypeptidase
VQASPGRRGGGWVKPSHLTARRRRRQAPASARGLRSRWRRWSRKPWWRAFSVAWTGSAVGEVTLKRPRRILGLVLLTVPVLGAIVLAWGWWALAMPQGGAPPIVYLDMDGREIPSLESEDGRIQMWVPLEHIPPTVAAAVIAAEDRRFMRHHGVDLPALARAALTNTRGPPSCAAPARSRSSSPAGSS